MNRQNFAPRLKWQEKVESIGLTYHSHENGPYWDESAFYEFDAREIDMLEQAANTLHELYLAAVGAVMEKGWWDRLGIPEAAIPVLEASWERDDFSLYGRFDVIYDGHNATKLLEYNADTPTALLEAAVAQWYWLQDCQPGADQFNSIHERLIEAWKTIGNQRVSFSAVRDYPEDEQTVLYLQDTCHQAGLDTRRLAVEDIGWNQGQRCFVDLEEEPITTCFKLYPWEWMWREEFAKYLATAPTQFIEPPWKMVCSNKALLPILWELNPGHPNLLPTFDSPAPLRGSYVQKPKLGREGANVTLVRQGETVAATDGDYAGEGYIYQEPTPLPDFDGNHPVLGLWIVHHEAAGLGIREDRSLVIGNTSRFVPHLFR